jgi:carboxypeptidase PM20D1
MVLDEGGMFVRGLMPGIDRPIALVGVAEKGVANFELSVEVKGGHSSNPPRHTAIGILSRAIRRLEDNPMEARLAGATLQMFQRLGPSMALPQRLALANLWLLEPLVTRTLAAGPPTGAMLRTTTAATVFHAGVKSNVLPSRASAVINFRILPGDSVSDVRAHVIETVADARVKVVAIGVRTEPSPVSSHAVDEFRLLESCILQTAREEGLIVAPYLLIGATDSRHFLPIADQVYRFSGITLRQGDLPRVHGVDERISIADYGRAIRFHNQLIRSLDSLPDS